MWIFNGWLQFFGLLVVTILLKPGSIVCQTTTEALPEYFDSFYSVYNSAFSGINMSTLQDIFVNQRCDQQISDQLIQNRATYRALPGHPTEVDLQVILTNVGGLSDRDQVATLTAFIDFRWSDPRLSVVFQNAGTQCAAENETFVTENMTGIWFPLFTIDNSATKLLFPEAWEKFPGILYPSGEVYWRSSFRLQLDCDMNFATFPYDIQNCEIIIRSPNYRLTDLQYIINPETLLVFWDEDANSDPLWTITGQASTLTKGVPGVKIWLRFERKASFYTWTLVLPTLVISVLTILTFLLPADHSEKMTTILTGVLAYFLLLLALTSITPEVSENLPALAIFFVCSIAVGVCGAVATAFILRFSTGRPHGKTTGILICCGLTPETLNMACLILYSIATAVCYGAYFMYIINTSKTHLNARSNKYNYTDVLFFNFTEALGYDYNP